MRLELRVHGILRDYLTRTLPAPLQLIVAVVVPAPVVVGDLLLRELLEPEPVVFEEAELAQKVPENLLEAVLRELLLGLKIVLEEGFQRE